MTTPRCAPFREWQTEQTHLLRAPDGSEVFVNWGGIPNPKSWWGPPINASGEEAHAAGWKYIGMTLKPAQATALIRARDGLAARLTTTLQENTTLRARLQRVNTALDNLAALTTTQAPPAALHDAVSVALASARAELERGA
jgi:hypothetical protein